MPDHPDLYATPDSAPRELIFNRPPMRDPAELAASQALAVEIGRHHADGLREPFLSPGPVARARLEPKVYSRGILFCSVCAPPDMTAEEVVAAINTSSPTGIDSPWQLSRQPMFSDGVTPNGGLVECERGNTRHWLLEC